MRRKFGAMSQRPVNRLDRYWRLRDIEKPTKAELEAELKQIGHSVFKSTKKAYLSLQADGAKRGALDYHKIKLGELDDFVRARGLSLRIDSEEDDEHTTVIKALWRADKRRSFPRFLDLPPELRIRVYEYHFASMPPKLRPCSQPPITKTSKLARGETLPMFYGTFDFELLIDHHETSRLSYLRPPNEVELFLAKTTAQNFRNVRKLHFRVEKPRIGADSKYMGQCMVSCDLAINPVAQTFKVKVKPSATKKDIMSWRRAGCNASQQIEDLLKGACERDSASGLTSDDIYKVRDILEAPFW